MRLLTSSFLLIFGGVAVADSDRLPKATDVRELIAYPSKLDIKGDEAPQLVISAVIANGQQRDLTGDVTYSIADPTKVVVAKSGRVMPLANGSTTISAQFAGKSTEIPVTLSNIGANLPVNFTNQVVPIFSKVGCNSGGCHGKASGQNGFRLSLLGFEPELDYATLVKEGRGRRLFPAAPERSLLLMKATGQIAHGGGRKLEPNSEEYKIIRRWIAAGMPFGSASDPTVTGITIYPEQRVLNKHDRQQLAVHAHYTNGSIEDITRRTQFDSNDQEIAQVDPTGVVSTFGVPGQAAVMARFQGQVTVFRAVVPVGKQIPAYTFEPRTFIDKLAQEKWKELGLVPSDLCSDEAFLRRVYLDITGTLPTAKEVAEFLADESTDKRAQRIDALLQSPEYAYFFANKWADVLRVKRGNNITRAFGTFSFHSWIHDAIASDKPYDEMVREIICAVGDEGKNPPAVWYKDILNADQFVDNSSQVFLGLRMACANCHHHPYEKWSQDDYWGLAAFYSRVGRKPVALPGQVMQGKRGGRELIYVTNKGNVVNKRTGKVATMRTLGGEPVTIAAGVDPRIQLADWLVDAGNPFFARAVANRYWAHFFTRGIVDPLDDMRVTNPPSNPRLLDALADDLVKNKYSLKHLIATICKSRVYQLSATPNEFNKHDKQSYARYYPKRMNAEVLLDAVSQVTNSPASFTGVPRDRYAPNRAIMLPDESFQSYFLDVFGRPQRISSCECERVGEANLAQTLHLLNSDEVQAKLSRTGGRADLLAKDPRPDREKVEELFVWCWGRKPNEMQLNKALDNIAKHEKTKKDAYENILWALINSKAFVFNQ